MVQLSCAVIGRSPDDMPAPPAPLVVDAHPDGCRVAGAFPSGVSLAEARARMAAFLTEAGVAEAVDLFLGRPFAPAAWGQPPGLADLFVARHAAFGGRVWARLFGLYALGESDVIASVDPKVPEEALYRLLTHYAAFRLDAHYRAVEHRRDRPIPYGYWFLGLADADLADDAFWATLRTELHTQHLRHAFADGMATPAPLFLTEAPAVDEAFGAFDLGVTRAALSEDRQLRAARRFGVAGRVEAPSSHDAAGLCDRLDAALQRAPAEALELFAYREAPRSDLDSGWRFGCTDPDHVHDRDAFRVVPLHRAVALAPPIADYLALPPGFVVALEEGAFWVQPPGESRAFRDDDADVGAP
jgi:hypothetical protein